MPAPTNMNGFSAMKNAATSGGLSDTLSLFSVEGLVAVVTGGGTGASIGARPRLLAPR